MRSKSKLFVFDLDETLVGGDVIEAVSHSMINNKQLDRVYTGADVTTWDLDGIPDILKKAVFEAFSDKYYGCMMKRPIPESYYFLSALTLYKCKISILTARPKNLENLTIKKLKLDFPRIKFEDIIFANNGNAISTGANRINKYDALKKLNPDFFFDDAIEYCNSSASLGINTFLISNKYSGWNHNQSKLDNKVKVLKHIGKFDYKLLS